MTTNIQTDQHEHTEEHESKARMFYRRFVRFSEYYIFLCFVIIIVVPLFEYAWVPGFIRTIYLTGFPLLLVIVLASFIKEPMLKFFENRWPDTPVNKTDQKTSSR